MSAKALRSLSVFVRFRSRNAHFRKQLLTELRKNSDVSPNGLLRFLLTFFDHAPLPLSKGESWFEAALREIHLQGGAGVGGKIYVRK